jgi:cutinase
MNRNDLKSSTTCKPVTLIFARGSIEPGNMGVIVGPGLAEAVKKAGIDAAVQGVDYNSNDVVNGIPAGVKLMVQEADDTAVKCPSSKIVLSGYSSGGIVTDYAVPKLKPETLKHVAAIVTFGFPASLLKTLPAAVRDKAKTFCKTDDQIAQCGDVSTGASGTGSHFSYGGSATDAAAYIKQHLRR